MLACSFPRRALSTLWVFEGYPVIRSPVLCPGSHPSSGLPFGAAVVVVARPSCRPGSRLPWRRLTAFTLSNKAQHSRSTYGTKRSALRLHAVRAWFGRTIDSVSGMRQGWFPSLSFQYGFRQQTPTLKHAVGDLVSFPLLCFQVISIALMTDILRI